MAKLINLQNVLSSAIRLEDQLETLSRQPRRDWTQIKEVSDAANKLWRLISKIKEPVSLERIEKRLQNIKVLKAP